MINSRPMQLLLLTTLMFIALFELYVRQYELLVECNKTVAQLQVEHLTARRHEKDFISRRESRFKTQWIGSVRANKKLLSDLYQCQLLDKHKRNLIEISLTKLNQYENLFYRHIAELKKIDSQGGEQLNVLIEQQNMIEKQAQIYDTNVYAQTLALRKHLFNYITVKNRVSIATLKNKTDALNRWEKLDPNLHIILSQYSASIGQLARQLSHQKYSNANGNLGALRIAIHGVEENSHQLARELELLQLNFKKFRILVYLTPPLFFLLLLLTLQTKTGHSIYTHLASTKIKGHSNTL